jgi:SWI/SNF-related matrix-associated actin-dependent regulator 1 of chromatin subfamily A
MNTVTVEKVNSRWIARCGYELRAVPKAAGFRWDPAQKVWFTTDGAIAAKLLDPDGAAKVLAEHEQKQQARAAAIEASRAADVDVDLPVPEGLAYLPYQRAGIAIALARPAVLFGDEMGLGKTIQFIGLLNADPTLKRVLIVCPASLRLNWKRELAKWLVREMTIAIATPQSCHPLYSDITIVNYDILSKLSAKLHSVDWDAICCDEAHYLKNPEAKRTQAIVGKEKKGQVEAEPIKARKRVFLTGTPIPNRPIEGWPLFHYLDPVEFKSFFGYAKRYAAAASNGYGWDFSGSSNLPELQDKLRASIMIRRLKADVLKELPAKRRSVIEIQAEDVDCVSLEQEAWQRHEDAMLTMRTAVELAKASDDPQDYKDAVDRLKEAAQASFTEMSQLRHDTAVAKIPYVIEHLRNVTENGAKVVVFAHHHDVIEAIAKEFGSAAVTVYGATPMIERQQSVDRFQTDPSCLVFVGGILAAGVGLTLTAASHVVFAELDWVPGNVTQAEDRCHRIGQHDMVLVEHLVLEGSLDARMAHILVAKQEVIAAALDEKVVEAPVVPVKERERAATESVSRDKLGELAAKLTAEKIYAIHQALQMLAGRCDGARELDGAGFSRIDVAIGHSLADAFSLTPRQAALGAKLVNKYRRQLPQTVLEAVAA